MDTFIQGLSVAMVAVVLCLLLSRYGKDMTMLLSLAACGIILLAAIRFLEPVLEFIEMLKGSIGVENGYIGIIIKAVGVGLVGEWVALLCADAGDSAIARTVELLTAAAVLWLSIPLMTALLELVQTMTGEL